MGTLDVSFDRILMAPAQLIMESSALVVYDGVLIMFCLKVEKVSNYLNEIWSVYVFICRNVDSDQMPLSMTFDLVLHVFMQKCRPR